MKKKNLAKYQKPKIKSSKIKTISFYGRNNIRSASDAEYHLAVLTSDRKAKKDIRKLSYGLEEVMGLKTWSYKKISGSPDPNGIGLIAQELYEIMPEIVKRPEKQDELWKINYAKLIPVLIKAVQQQQTKIAELEEKLAKLQEN